MSATEFSPRLGLPRSTRPCLQGHHAIVLFGGAWFLPYIVASIDGPHWAVFVDTAQGSQFNFGVPALICVVLVTQATLGSVLICRDRSLSWRDLGFRRTHLRWFCVALASLMAIKVCFGPLAAEFAELADMEIPMRDRAMRSTATVEITVILLVAGGPATAIVEELFFRGVLHNWLRSRLNLTVGACLSALVFSLVHRTFLDPGGVVGWIAATELFVGGVVLALLFEKSGSIWPSIYMHTVNNLIGPLQSLLDG